MLQIGLIMQKTSLITGASKGIGKELAYVFAEDGCNLVLVARSGDKLKSLKEQLEQQYAISVVLIEKDLSQKEAAKEIYEEVTSKGLTIDYLVNNAGFGDYGFFADTPFEVYQEMIALNITSLTHLTHLFVLEWRESNKKVKILNISSTAAFQPGPMMAVYFATKAFVLHFSEAVGNELKKNHITITTLCPGPTTTHFGEVSKMNASQLVKNVKIANAREVALLGYKAMMKGKSVVIHGAMNKLAPFAIRFLPRKWVLKLSAKVMRQQ